MRTPHNRRKLLEQGLEEQECCWTPYYKTASGCCMVIVPVGNKRHLRVRIKKVPEEHEMLRAVCDTVQDELGLKLYYKGESAASLGNALVQQLMVQRRKALSPEDKQTLMERQQGKCDICGDRLQEGSYEIDHIHPLCNGSAYNMDNMRLLHPVCHSMATSQLRTGRRSLSHSRIAVFFRNGAPL